MLAHRLPDLPHFAGIRSEALNIFALVEWDCASCETRTSTTWRWRRDVAAAADVLVVRRGRWSGNPYDSPQSTICRSTFPTVGTIDWLSLFTQNDDTRQHPAPRDSCHRWRVPVKPGRAHSIRYGAEPAIYTVAGTRISCRGNVGGSAAAEQPRIRRPVAHANGGPTSRVICPSCRRWFRRVRRRARLRPHEDPEGMWTCPTTAG